MKKSSQILLLSVWLFGVPVASLLTPSSVVADQANEYVELDWVALIPDDDLQALLNPPDWLAEIEDGSDLDDTSLLSSRTEMDDRDSRYRQALESSAVRGELADKKIRLPGYVVPLAFDDRRRVIEFFLVPYMGACLHLPPPPPNQLVHVTYELGLELDSLYTPYWIEGDLLIKSTSNAIAQAAYAIKVHKVEVYEF